MNRTVIASLLCGALVASPGCAHKYVEKVAIYRPADGSTVVQPAPRSGMYGVRFFDEKKQIHTPLYAADRWIDRGENIGFSADERGEVVAIAGDQKVPLGPAPAHATSVMWFHKSTKPTALGGQATLLAEQIANFTLTVVGWTAVGAMVAGSVYLQVFSGTDDCATDPPSQRRHRAHHHQ